MIKSAKAIKNDNFEDMKIIINYPLTNSFATQWVFSPSKVFDKIKLNHENDELNDFFKELIRSEQINFHGLTNLAYYLDKLSLETQKLFFSILEEKASKDNFISLFYKKKLFYSFSSKSSLIWVFGDLFVTLIIFLTFFALISIGFNYPFFSEIFYLIIIFTSFGLLLIISIYGLFMLH